MKIEVRILSYGVVRSRSTSLGLSSDLFLLKNGVIFSFTRTNIVELIHFTSVKLGICSKLFYSHSGTLNAATGLALDDRRSPVNTAVVDK